MDGKGCGLLIGGALFALVVVIFLVVAATGGAHLRQTVRASGGCFLSIGDGCNVTIYQEAAQPADCGARRPG